MGRRIEVELTSTREDGSWTWRAAGARQPKGEMAADLLYSGAKVGDVVKAEADFHLDGIEIVEVFPPKAKRERSGLLELKSRPVRDDELVTTQRVSRGRRNDDRGRRRGDRPSRSGRDRRGDQRTGSARRPSRPDRSKPKRLRPRRVHRDALLASVPEEHQPIVDQVIRDGMPGVRAAIEKQNAEAKTAGKPEIDAAPILAIAEKNLTAARLAEWRDRADAALSDIDELDLRDLRSVVVVGSDVARDEETRAIADQLKAGLDRRMERDHEQWLSDLKSAVGEGRVVRALRLSSRPVKAGSPLPTELAGELAKQASAALAGDVEQQRWGVVLDALAFSPVRSAVTPAGVPPEPGEELLAEVRRLSDRVPAIAALFGIDPAQVPRRAKRRRPSRSGAGEGRSKSSKSKAAPKAKSPVADGAGESAVEAAKPSDDAKTSTAPASEPKQDSREAVDPQPPPDPKAVEAPAEAQGAEPEVVEEPAEAAAPVPPAEAPEVQGDHEDSSEDE